MTTRFAYRIDVERMLKTFDLLSKVDGLEVVVKPHTRSGKEAKVYETIPLSNVYEFSSVELCEWADIMIVIGSSILIETLVQRKPVLYLKYLHENTTQYEEFGACWTIRDEAQLKEALLSLLERVPLDGAIARRAGQLRQRIGLARLSLPDAAIAASAEHSGCTLLTRNTHCFQPLADITPVEFYP